MNKRTLLDKFARIKGFNKKAYRNWKEHKAKHYASYKTGLGIARDHPLVLKDLEELAGLAVKESRQEKVKA